MKRYIAILIICFPICSLSQKKPIKLIKHTHEECEFSGSIIDTVSFHWLQSVSFDITSPIISIQKSWGYLEDSTIEGFMLRSTSASDLEYSDLEWSNPELNDDFIFTVDANKLDTALNILYTIDIRVTGRKVKKNIILSKFIGDSLHMETYLLTDEIVDYYKVWIENDLLTKDSISAPIWPIINVDSLSKTKTFIRYIDDNNEQWFYGNFIIEPYLYNLQDKRTPKYIRKYSKLVDRKKLYKKWEEFDGCTKHTYEIYFKEK